METVAQTDPTIQTLATIRQSLLRRFRKEKSPRFALLEQAIEDAVYYHRDQFRKSGDPGIIHPFRVALLVSEAGMDVEGVIIALLHDIIEDTELTKDMVGAKYGEWLAGVVDGLTKFTPAEKRERSTPDSIETYRKLLTSTVKDMRTLQVKIFDRLDNMRDLGFLDRTRQRRISRETLFVYVPMAQRLGMQEIATELNTLGFRYLYPLRFQRVLEVIKAGMKAEEKKVKGFQKTVEQALKSMTGKATVTPKYFQVTDYIFDKGDVGRTWKGFSVCVAEAESCYAALGALHRAHRVVPNSIRDFISNPKPNRYQALESKVFLGSEPVTIEVFSKEMDIVNRRGILADWRASRDELAEYYATYLELLDQLTDNDDLRMEDVLRYGQLDSKQVFTPMGEVVTLPQRATVLDFAFAIHTDLGIHCEGAWVEGRKVGRFEELGDGTMVEVITSKETIPHAIWLGHAVTPRAKLAIRRAVKTRRLSRAADVGKRLFLAHLKRMKIEPEAFQESKAFQEALTNLKLKPNKFFEQVGTREIDFPAFLAENRLATEKQMELLERKSSAGWLSYLKPARSPDPYLRIPQFGDEFIHLAPCCSPLPGDEIVGIQQEQGILVHRAECPVLGKAAPGITLPVGWEPGQAKSSYRLTLKVKDSPGQIYRIGKIMRDLKVNIHDLSVDRTEPVKGQAQIRLILEPIPLQIFHKIVSRLRGFKEVLKIS